MRAAVVRVGRLVGLDTELRVDEDGAISPEVVHDNTFVVFHLSSPLQRLCNPSANLSSAPDDSASAMRLQPGNLQQTIST